MPGVALVLAVMVVYLPVWRADYIWDDDSVVLLNPAVTSPGGLLAIWTTNAADICPLTLSTFWLEYRLWGGAPLPFHLVTLLFHAGAAIALWRVLRRLRIRGAWLGAAIWALHPVVVESVAWISEMKNTESGLFFLLSILFFLRGLEDADENNSWRRNDVACLVFTALALASKSSTVVLAPVLCLCAWWMEGGWKGRTLVRTAPVFALAAVAALVSIWTQHHTKGYEFLPERNWPERLVVAGDAVWFYLGKLIWPQPLLIVYPRWHVEAGNVMAWLPLAAVVAMLAALDLTRRARPAFFAFAYFVVALLPILGLVGMSYFRFSYVADHFQYLASMGPLAFAAAGLVACLKGAFGAGARLVPIAGAALLMLLGTLSWRHAVVFQNIEGVWSDTLAGNPDCWVAYNSLGVWYFESGQLEKSLVVLKRGLELAPTDAEAHYNYGRALVQAGRSEEGLNEFRTALKFDPSLPQARNNLGIALGREGKVDDAIAQFRQLLQANPDYAQGHYNLGVALMQKGDIDDAITEFQSALKLNPDTQAGSLGVCYVQKGRLNDAIGVFEDVVKRHPNDTNARNNLGAALQSAGRKREAIAQFQEALRIDPNDASAQKNLANARAAAGEH